MDRYQLATEFAFIAQADEIRRMRDPIELKETALGLLKINYGLRAVLAAEIAEEIPITQQLDQG